MKASSAGNGEQSARSSRLAMTVEGGSRLDGDYKRARRACEDSRIRGPRAVEWHKAIWQWLSGPRRSAAGDVGGCSELDAGQGQQRG
jgi:hypothetical protein